VVVLALRMVTAVNHTTNSWKSLRMISLLPTSSFRAGNLSNVIPMMPGLLVRLKVCTLEILTASAKVVNTSTFADAVWLIENALEVVPLVNMMSAVGVNKHTGKYVMHLGEGTTIHSVKNRSVVNPSSRSKNNPLPRFVCGSDGPALT